MRKLLYMMAFVSSALLFSQSGKVGIGTTAPQTTLHVKGSLRLEHPSQGKGKILRVYDTGAMKWANAVPLPVYGSFEVQDGYTVKTITNDTYFKSFITLSPGKWIVKLSFLLTVRDLGGSTDEGYVVETYLADSNTSSTPTTDYVEGSSTMMGGTAYTPSIYNLLQGSVLIENKDNIAKTYYLWGKAIKYPTTSTSTVSLDRLASNIWSENRIYAIPIE